MQHDVERVREAGFHGFIGKPLDHNRFPDQIRRILAGKSVWDSPRG
jgi:two-component system cell cycle response regulator DivK